MAYYHNLITKKSWEALQQFRKEYKFILIGGWAVFLYTKNLKSKDIDFICEYDQLQKLKENFDLIKNERLKKYEIKEEKIDIDIYLPFYSELGVPIEIIRQYTQSQESFIIPKPEILLILKQIAYNSRRGSIKGEKDKIDVLSLIQIPFDFKFYRKILKRCGKEALANDMKNLLANTKEIPELNLNQHRWARIKKKLLKNL